MKQTDNRGSDKNHSYNYSSHSRYEPLNLKFPQLETHYDPIYRALWCTLKSTPIPAFTPTLLENIRFLQDTVAEFCENNSATPPKYMVWLSDNPYVFNLGLDLTHIYQLISQHNREELDKYLQTCIDIFIINLFKLDIPSLITMCLIRGKAFGGGLEAALSCDIVVAEKNSRCCFPEIRYNLLPPLGACKILLQHYSQAILHPMLFEGKNFSLDKLVEHGVIEAAIDSGMGAAFLKNKIEQIHAKHDLLAALYATTKSHKGEISYEEIERFKLNWINSAMKLQQRDLVRLERLAHAQRKMEKYHN